MINPTRQTKTLLLELGCEELPAGSVAAMAAAFATSTLALLNC
jgi:glycyl-tRNA synthetase beta subunit